MAVHATGACTFVASSYLIVGFRIVSKKPWNNDYDKLAKFFSKSGTPKTRFFAKIFMMYMLFSCAFWSWVRFIILQYSQLIILIFLILSSPVVLIYIPT